MPKTAGQLNWQHAAIYGAVLVGAITIALLTRESNVSAHTPGESRVIPHSESAITSWNRYRSFSAAYRRALRETPASFGLSDFVVSSTYPMPRREGTKKAIAAFLHIVKDTPDEDGAWSNLAWLYAINGDLTTAIVSEQRAISLYRYDYTYYVLLGSFLIRAGQTDQAGAAFGQALLLYPRLTKSKFWHTLRSHQPVLAATAKTMANKLLNEEQGETDEVSHNEVRARFAAENGLASEASNIVRGINSRLPNLSGMWELQGELNEEEGNTSEAILDYRRAVFLDTADPLPHERLAELHLMASDANGARLEVLQAWRLAKHPKSPGATRRTVQYQHRDGSSEGQMPATLGKEMQPSFNFESIFSSLTDLFDAQGATDQANEMRDLLNQTDTRSVLYGDSGTDK